MQEQKQSERATLQEVARSCGLSANHVIPPTDASADDFTARPMPRPEDPYPLTLPEVKDKFEIVEWDGVYVATLYLNMNSSSQRGQDPSDHHRPHRTGLCPPSGSAIQ